jgi:hypothetical protein
MKQAGKDPFAVERAGLAGGIDHGVPEHRQQRRFVGRRGIFQRHERISPRRADGNGRRPISAAARGKIHQALAQGDDWRVRRH